MAVNELTDIQKAYVRHRLRGLNVQQAADAAGLKHPHDNGHRLEEAVGVQLELQEKRRELAKKVGITRDHVVAGLFEAAGMAKEMADPVAMVTAWRELGKLLGYYAPEVKRIEKGISKGDLIKALEDMSDEELLRYTGGRVVEGTVVGKTEDTAPQVPQLQ